MTEERAPGWCGLRIWLETPQEHMERELELLGIYMDPFHAGRAVAILNRLAPGWRERRAAGCSGAPGMRCSDG